MKHIHLTLTLLGTILFIFQVNAQENNDSTCYFLLDRNTKLISYYEKAEIRKDIQGIFRRYDFKSEINTDEPMHASLIHFGKAHPRPHKIIVKPLAFLDSIHYYDEKWLTETEDLMYTHDLNKYTLYVIDKATFKNDSITLYQVKYSFSGRE